jgi:hypothetical protein
MGNTIMNLTITIILLYSLNILMIFENLNCLESIVLLYHYNLKKIFYFIIIFYYLYIFRCQ